MLCMRDSFLAQKHSTQSGFWLIFFPLYSLPFCRFHCFYQVFHRFVVSLKESCALVIMDNHQGIRGDGRCLFRSVVHGACLRAGKPSPSDSHQKELADELREKVADEFIKRRADTEWFLEDDFERYVVQMRQPHIWGGEPELLMSSHVLHLYAGQEF
ncbi:OVARIAN TUMOR DOMAIN-containing deubiquitinating enzyme 4 isoform X3 [Rosa chinensis]|uniref:OVARIAN TUMOR DOMAIN-containing deubiquitinating enzyme 4 isoform X3 n=1 Tax=Rosa chinensis TaxID=74649 RepID=UPI001AD90B40|nr:OVARIAN TUMOR DOMAIN-containing deubiquitinating enzyme 4 isoform X3 [Rosa chinensis]